MISTKIKVLLCSIPLPWLVGCGNGEIGTTNQLTQAYSIGGTLNGLEGGTVSLLNNATSERLDLNTDGTFTFVNKVTNYSVTIGKQPIGFQWCNVTDGLGTASGNVSSVDVRCGAAAVQVSTFSGSGTAGYTNGASGESAFYNPVGVAADTAGNLYVADAFNSLVRKIAPDGVVTTVAGSATSGFADGVGTAAEFNHLHSLALDSSNNLYVADTDNNRIRKITSDGVVTTFAGSGTVGNVDGTGVTAEFNQPYGVAFDSSGTLYVADTYNSLIRKITPDGVVTTLAGSGTAGYADGTGTAAVFDHPRRLAFDSADNLYVADTGNNVVRKISPAGVVKTFAGSGTAGYVDGASTAAKFDHPDCVAVDGLGNVYVIDTFNNRIRKITSNGDVTTFAGSGTADYEDGIGTAASFNRPNGGGFDRSGNLYVADTFNNRIRKVAAISPVN